MDLHLGFEPEQVGNMENNNSAIKTLRKELILRIYKKERGKVLTKREQRALDVWFRSKARSRPQGKAWAGARKLTRKFSEFEEVFEKKEDWLLG